VSERQAGMDDWVVPVVLVGLSLGLLFVVGTAFAVSAEDRAEAPTLITDLDAYTACLVDHGADVPRVVVGRDGGFTVVMPGSVAEGDIDGSAWSEAADKCADVAPDVFGPLFGGFSLDWFEGLEGHDEAFDAETFRCGLDEGGGRRERSGQGPWMPPPDELRRRCDQLEEAGIGVEGLRGDRLRRLCEDLDR